jgi:hypothetical protein
MDLLSRFLRFCFGGCRHRDSYRERRPLHGVQVLHFVCADCGHAVPAVPRTAEEHRLVVSAGALRPMTAHRAPQMALIAADRFGVQMKQRRRARA